MKYYIIAGERSGELHGSNLIKALKAEDDNAEVRCWGGEMMQQAGGDLVVHYSELAVMGFVEVLMSIFKILRYFRFFKKDLQAFEPNVLILIDYAGFNLRAAKFAKKRGFKVFYYISPKIWAWNTGRAKKIKKNVDRMFSILPFERDFFAKYNIKVDYVGNPVVDAIQSFEPDPQFKAENQLNNHQQIVALLPGSRRQELKMMLTTMLEVAQEMPDQFFVVAGVTNLDVSLYDPVKEHANVKVIYERNYDLLSISDAALVTSGTATLETALFSVPQAVLYKTSSRFTYHFVKAIIKVPFISLVNLIAGKEVVKEMIQDEMTADKVGEELKQLVQDSPKRKAAIEGYEEIRKTLGTENASKKTARLMVNYLAESNK